MEFFELATASLARDLLGRQLWRRLPDGRCLGGRIVETEAYFGPGDRASHAYRRTPRSEIMYGPPGLAYVYFTYGTHHCVNVVAEPDGEAGAVLLRALEPLEGIEEMARRRGKAARKRSVAGGAGEINLRALCSGPGKLTRALGIDLRLNGADLRGPDLWIAAGAPAPDSEVAITSRIGIRVAVRRKARYIIKGSPFLSR